jgi:hypothetical protein
LVGFFDLRDWRMRLNGSVKQEGSNCGIHTGANTMAIAFGYNLNHLGRSFDNRRKRMACEAWKAKFTAAGDYS